MAEFSLTSLSISFLDSANELSLSIPLLLISVSMSVSTNESTSDSLLLSDPDKDCVVVLSDLLLVALSRSYSTSFLLNKSMNGPLLAS